MAFDIQNPSINTELVFSKEQAIEDYRLMYRSRQASLIGRKEVLTGKAKFGIFGDGKELPQIALAKFFQNGDIRAGYYRDQTIAFATGLSDIRQFFAQLYANPNLEAEPHSAGRQMNGHFASRHIDDDGNWVDMTQNPLSSADGSSTASQMPRLVGLGQASKLYRQRPELAEIHPFSENGNEVAFGTIGNASSAEGHFWEALNAIGVLQVPVVMSIWDDEYGISVPNEYQLTRDLSDMLSGFQQDEENRGFNLYRVRGWDYEALCNTYQEAVNNTRESHIPSIVHVVEVTQPQGHSTSGSHERYKSPERLAWEREHDCLAKMRLYLLEKGYVSEEELEDWEKAERKNVRKIKNEAWQEVQAPIKRELANLHAMIADIKPAVPDTSKLDEISVQIQKTHEPAMRTLMNLSYQALFECRDLIDHPPVQKLKDWRASMMDKGDEIYSSHLYSETPNSPLHVASVDAQYAEDAPLLSGFEILNRAFDQMLADNPLLLAFGEDVGQLGDVNQGFAGLQAKYGKNRVMDTGIREATIMGQAIGLAQRGFRPIAEIQYLDYLIYGLQTLSDDLSCLRYRTKGGQMAPVIIRTRGHRLEGIWHAGSPLGMMLHSLRGMHIAVPRNMTQAAGFYHTFLKGDDPAVIIEVLNGYRLKEKMPDNLSEIQIPLGVPEVIRSGTDVTLVTYGACCRIAMEAASQLATCGIEAEVIDVRTLLPFDKNQMILESLKKTNRIVFLDEDVPGGATAYMMQIVMEEHKGYYFLDSEPRTISAKAHRPAYGDDGDYWSKPQVDTVFQSIYDLMNEADPKRFPLFL